MNKLIIIGNGFDLAHNLDTSYKSFLLWYLNNFFQNSCIKVGYEDDLLKSENSKFINTKIKIPSVSEFEKTINDLGFKLTYKSTFFKKIVHNYKNNKWVDIETEYYKSLIESAKSGTEDRFMSNDFTNRSAFKLNNEFNFLKEKLVEYLKGIDVKSCEIKPEIFNKFKNIVYEPFGAYSSKIMDDKILVLNFNYTPTVELYFKSNDYSLQVKVINIHGSIEDSTNPIIFGYGDEMDKHYESVENLNSNEFLKNIKSFCYFLTSNYKEFLSFIDDKTSKFNVYIMGHSCGISDRILLNTIFEHDKCEKIKIYYHKKSETNFDYFEKTQEISRHFKASNKGIMRKRIVPFNECLPLVDINK
jgi:hypothetical protein